MTEKEKPKDPYQQYKDFKWENPDDFRNGPMADETRKCRDIFCCLIFIVFLVACVAVAVLGFYYGHPSYFLYVYDEDGNACGKDGVYKDYKYLYFYQVISNAKKLEPGEMINGFCVKECPKNDFKDKDASTVNKVNLDCVPTKNNKDCNVTFENYYESKSILNRICFPMDDEEITIDTTNYRQIDIYDPETKSTFKKVVYKGDVITENGKEYVSLETVGGGNSQDSSGRLINWSYFSVDRLSTWLSDLYVTRWAIVGSLAWSFVIAMIYLLLLRLCAGFLVFLVIILILAGLIILAAYFKITSDEHDPQEDNVYYNTYTALFWVFLVLAILWIIFIIAMCNRIRLAVALVQITAKYINNVWCIVFIPFLFFVIVIIWMVYWIALSIFLYATGDFDQEGSKVIANFEWDAKIRYSWWFHLFALFYMTAVISAYSSFVYSSSACIWYFTSEKGIEAPPIRTSFKRGIRYHFGSLSFGALIIAIVRLIMVWLEVVKKRVESTSTNKTESKCFKCIISCLQCCVGCCAKCMEYVNRHAFIQIALKGDSFCTAAWEGFGLIVRNLGRFTVLTAIGTIFTVIGTIFISVVSGVIGYFVITKVSYFSDELNSCVLPVVVFIIIGLILGLVTMSIFGTSGDALMHSFLLDEELNKGQAKAFPELQKFMNDER